MYGINRNLQFLFTQCFTGKLYSNSILVFIFRIYKTKPWNSAWHCTWRVADGRHTLIERLIKMRRIIQKLLSNLIVCLLIVNPTAKVSNKLLMSSEKPLLNAVQCLELNRQKSSFFLELFISKIESKCKKSMSNNKQLLSGNTHSLFYNENLSVH